MAKKGNVAFDKERCKSCGLCIEVCPKGIIYIDQSFINQRGYNPVAISDMTECIGCASCALMCPDVVITVEKE